MIFVDWDALEDAGHHFTLVGMIQAGCNLYFCESCGTLMIVANSNDKPIFHMNSSVGTSMEKCSNNFSAPETLKAKLDSLNAAAWERLKRI